MGLKYKLLDAEGNINSRGCIICHSGYIIDEIATY